jgi:transcriptional regulator with XRE-family HTH domain
MKITDLSPLSSTLTELGRRLVENRKRMGLSQDEMARQAGVGVATLRRIEGGQDAQLGSWIKIMNCLGEIESIDTLLPEHIRSPMMDMGKKPKSKPTVSDGAESEIWGDEL